MENQVSMLPQPIARPVGSVRALNDLSESDNNTRSAMPPPSCTTASAAASSGLKRQGSNLPEPAQKRKTLVERAGEPLRAPSNASSISRPPSATSQYAPTGIYRSSSSASTVSRANSLSSRNTSNSSYTGSLNSGIRPPKMASTTNTARPKSSYAGDKPFGAASRPNTSIANLQASHEAHANKSKTPSFSQVNGPSNLDGPNWKTLSPIPKYSSMIDLRQRKSSKPNSTAIKRRRKTRDLSITLQLENLHLGEARLEPMQPPKTPARPKSPSKIPIASPVPSGTPSCDPFATPKLRHKATMDSKKFLTPYSTIESFDPDVPYQDWKKMFDDSRQMIEEAVTKFTGAKEETNAMKEKLNQTEQEKISQSESLMLAKAELQASLTKNELLKKSNAESKQENQERIDDLRREHRQDLETLRQEHRSEVENLKSIHREELTQLRAQQDEYLMQERRQKMDALSQISSQGVLEKQQHELALQRKDQDIAVIKKELEATATSLEREKQINEDLRASLRNAGENASSMESARQAQQAKIAFLESDNKSQSEAYAAMEKRMNEAIARTAQTLDKLRREEIMRRKLHNQVQELKGNIRVYCRVRPIQSSEEDEASIKFPDELEEATQIEVKGPEEKSSQGKDVTKTYPYTFDRVFNSTQTNEHVCTEVSGLIDSAMDGFNVCIFAYGQTGSGKTHTMMSPEGGVIPNALRQIYDRRTDQEQIGWSYTMHGSFVEVYNEEIRDLLGNDGSTKKHEVHHDLQNNETSITNTNVLSLDSKTEVENMISQAMARRSVAATKANEQSSRSHSVFILKITGKNHVTLQETKGTLNLVDLAGSERIKNAETSGQRLKETQSINKSLSCLGDVIGALGQGPAGPEVRSILSSGRDTPTGHIPYRNSKLTHLLQLSLGGNCKTLMFVMVAPEKRCLGETLTSLRFAEKVSRTRVGVAKRVK